jgi:BolA protein
MTNGNGGRAERLEAVLRAEFAPSQLDVIDESALHAGHSGARAGGETHYQVSLVSERFTGMTRVARSRLVHSVLKSEFDSGLHALSLRLGSPTEG